MIYVQLKERAVLQPGEKVCLHHVADVFGEESKSLLDLPVECPTSSGIWRLPALSVVKALQPIRQEMTLLGPSECFVHIIQDQQRDRTHLIRTFFAFLLLMIGSAFAITWFHADVNMAQAQQSIYRLITGHAAANENLLVIPYSIGIFFGVMLFYALIGRKGTISPLEIKSSEYQASLEKEMGKIP